MIVNAEQRTDKSQYFAKGDKHWIVDNTGRRNDKPCDEQPCAEYDKYDGWNELQFAVVLNER